MTLNFFFHYYAHGFYAVDIFGACSPDTPIGTVASVGGTIPFPSCNTGQSVGWINGQPICYQTSIDTPPQPTVSSTSSTTSGVNAQGLATVTTTDISSNGTETQTTVTTNPDGSTTTNSTVVPVDPIAEAAFCVANPQDSSCAPLTDCEIDPDTFGCLDAGTPADTNVVGEKIVNVGITPYNFGIAAGCPADRSITVWGGGVVPIPLNKICDFATMIKPLALAMAWLAGGFIVFGSFKQG